MKKQTLIRLALIPLFLSVVITVAQSQVSSEEATLVAKNFYLERIFQKPDFQSIPQQVEEVFLVEKEGIGLYYVVNIGDGFVLVSAAEKVWPVPAYSFESHFIKPETEENVIAWLRQYEKQIMDANSRNAPPTLEISQAWQKYSNPDFRPEESIKLRDMEPMLVSKWNQGKYYNEFCPADPAGPGGHCYAGCVATAMGQVMNYFRFPETGLGSYTYYLPTYDTISADFGNTTYRWNEMVNSVGSSNHAVAELLFHLGVSVDMVYGPNGSGMYNHKAAYSLKTYFKYSPETQYCYRDSTTMDWDSLLVTHLDQRIPMYYAGWSVPNINGHAFVCDGYQGDHYYHFNWGWGGSYDGYFYTEELTPGGSNFNLAQELIIHCFPDTMLYTYPEYCQGLTHLTHHEGTIDDGSGPAYLYQPNSDCSFLIDTQTAEDSVTSITLSFDRFALLENDNLSVFDGGDENAPLLGSFTGETIPNNIISSGNKLFLDFHSDSGDSSHGFFASYASQHPQWCSGMNILTSPEGTIEDGSGSFFYNNNIVCMWQIIPDWANELTLTFSKFKTEANSDVVKIYDLATSQLLATYSGIYEPGNLPDPVTSPSGKIFITFTTNSYNRFDGWEADYSVGNVGINDNHKTDAYFIFPNPTQGMLIIEKHNYDLQPVSVEVMNHIGQVESANIFTATQWPVALNISDRPAGIYLIKIKTNEFVIIKKVVKN